MFVWEDGEAGNELETFRARTLIRKNPTVNVISSDKLVYEVHVSPC